MASCIQSDIEEDTNTIDSVRKVKTESTPTEEVYSSSFTEIVAEDLNNCCGVTMTTEINETNTQGEVITTSLMEEEGEEGESEIFILDDALQHINSPNGNHTEGEIDHHRELSLGEVSERHKNLFQRLKTGNMFLSRKKKCANVVSRSIARGAQKVPKKYLKVSLNPIDSLPSELHGKHGACTLALKIMKKINDETLVQEKWLNETSQLLDEQVLSIGVFGRHKAGKSTVLNALLHQEILPSAVKNETATLTKIYHDPKRHISNRKHNPNETCPNCPTMDPCSKTEILGRRKIRNTIRSENSSIRERVISIDERIKGHKVVACVPFMCSYSTGDIQVVLMDTPGLAEANELGITDISEHQLMTCSAYIYVISCTQLEDEIDTETLRAIVERDPGVFQHRRMLIVVTRLDEYKERETTYNDKTSAEMDSDEDESPDLLHLISNIKQTIREQFQDFVDIPESCIIPVSATGSLESRKVANGEKSRESEVLLLNFKARVGRSISVQELDECSQIPVLEKCLGDIVSNSYKIWTYAIVRDCSRYLEHAIVELASMEDYFKSIEKKFADKRDEKIKTLDKFIWKKRDLLCRYEQGLKFHTLLESSYDEDVQSLYSFIDEKCETEFQSFEAQIMKQKTLTSQEYRASTEDFIVKANKSLMSEFERLKFYKVNKVIKDCYIRLGQDCNEMEHLIAAFCDVETSSTIVHSVTMERKEDDTRSRSETHSSMTSSVSTTLNDVPVRNAPLELKALLEHGKSLDYTVLDKVKILAQKIFLRLKNEDPRRILIDRERNALLEEVKKSLLSDSKQYFSDIKTNIIDSYLEELQWLVEDHMISIKERYKKRKKEMKENIKKWNEEADLFRHFAERQKVQTDFLTQQKVHLNYLYAKKFK